MDSGVLCSRDAQTSKRIASGNRYLGNIAICGRTESVFLARCKTQCHGIPRDPPLAMVEGGRWLHIEIGYGDPPRIIGMGQTG